MRKVVVNANVRALLLELDDEMLKFHAATKLLADLYISSSQAVRIGADRESVRARIVGIAYRINEESIRRSHKGGGRE